ncbi:MAG: hypothetical protein HeimC3_46730 [Candidatus Heimdallarchaeota archaeon LC_3]|nr:MAG: hypothetical protein HeimC3_46730 [Candidatus Heimdallarchaeota archaeon LC_3]
MISTPNPIKEDLEKILCYDDGIFNDIVKLSPSFPMVFLDELDLIPYLTISKNQSILKNRVHLIDTGSDFYGIFIPNSFPKS